MIRLARPLYSFAEYVRLEAESPLTKHELVDGVAWAMPPHSPEHAAIAANITTLLGVALRDKPCRVYSSDLRVRVLATGLTTYPDVTVVCDREQLDPADDKGLTVTNPKLIVEVSSPSTEHYDRGDKLIHYKQIESLETILLVAHDERRLEVWQRTEGRWGLDVVKGDGVAALSLHGCELPIADVYRNPLG